jgi:hypothetical protein
MGHGCTMGIRWVYDAVPPAKLIPNRCTRWGMGVRWVYDGCTMQYHQHLNNNLQTAMDMQQNIKLYSRLTLEKNIVFNTNNFTWNWRILEEVQMNEKFEFLTIQCSMLILFFILIQLLSNGCKGIYIYINILFINYNKFASSFFMILLLPLTKKILVNNKVSSTHQNQKI